MPFMISFSVILRSENTCCRRCPEYRQIVYENQLIDDCYPGHLLCSELSYHNIIQKTDQIRYGIL